MYLGVKADGTASICRAKPENRGKGNCKHVQHFPYEPLEPKAEATATLPKPIKRQKRAGFPKPKQGTFQITYNSRALTRAEFDQSVESVSEKFENPNWTFIRKFAEKVDNMTSPRTHNENSEIVENFLRSDDPIAKQTRDFLGEEIDLKNFSLILTKTVRSMTRPYKWKNGESLSINRIILSGFDNDMTNKRYVASVMFFGGRCCYCHSPMNKKPKHKKQATGEHITPVSPQNKGETYGSTRFGNMALACSECNNTRGNKELESWIEKTNKVPKELKQSSLDKIAEFRKYALYTDYTEQQMEMINAHLNKLHEDLAVFERVEGKWFTDDDAEKIDRLIKQCKLDLLDLIRS